MKIYLSVRRAAGLDKMYQDYIEGRKKLREINMAFHARYIWEEDVPEKGGCSYL